MTMTLLLPIGGAEAASSVLIVITLLFGPFNFVPLNVLVLGSNPYSSRFQTLFFKIFKTIVLGPCYLLLADMFS